MAPTDDAEDAAARLEAALERIAKLAQNRPAAVSAVESVPETRELADRLDSLIAQLRSALGASAA